jgi:hypothetical protein
LGSAVTPWILFLIAGATDPSVPAADALRDVVVDLSDGWVPRMLTDDPSLGEIGQHPYRSEFIRLANSPANKDEQFLELYGIPPSFAVLGARLTDDQRHDCHVAAAQGPSGPTRAGGRDAVRAVQQHLRCDGLLDGRPTGVVDGATIDGLRLYQREHAIIGSGVLDPETREALATDSRELDFRALLRALRERVIDATGIIEDGSALGRRQGVLGRHLDCREMSSTDRLAALPGGAPDLISPLTEQTARALGWSDPESAAAFFRRGGLGTTRSLHVHVSLPVPPAYHGTDMLLASEIVTGGQRPELRLVVRPSQGPDVVLVRWPTTKGGWQPEKTSSTAVMMKFKRSAMGDFVWRDLITAPAWFPPDTTPDEELVRKTVGGGFRLNREAVGPGYRSAYGLVMLIHHRPPMVSGTEGAPELFDAQTRTHGTANYRSVTRGDSHGCHRLYSALATRLAGFLLAHRPFVRRGEIVAHYRRTVVWQGHRMPLRADARGYLYQLTPPVPVRVVKLAEAPASP